MEVRLHFVMFEELEGSAGPHGLNAAGLGAGNSGIPVGEPPAIALISIVRGAEASDVDLEFDEEL